jgi:hypothetical protein
MPPNARRPSKILIDCDPGLPAANVTLALASDARRLVDDVIDTLIRYPEATR